MQQQYGQASSILLLGLHGSENFSQGGCLLFFKKKSKFNKKQKQNQKEREHVRKHSKSIPTCSVCKMSSREPRALVCNGGQNLAGATGQDYARTIPQRPLDPAPQHLARPSESTAHVWVLPAEICTALVMPETICLENLGFIFCYEHTAKTKFRCFFLIY